MKCKKILIIILLVLTCGNLFSCDKEPQKEKPKEHEEPLEDAYKADLDVSYIYDAKDYTYDVTPLIVSDSEVTLPDLTGLGRGEIKYIMDKLGVKYSFQFDFTIITSDDELNKFTRYSDPYKAGDVVSKDKFFYVFTTVLPITHKVSDKLTLDMNKCVGKSFINDGVGLVTLIRAIDGDTAWFKDTITNEEFKVRFLCINTTESTMKHDPWGKAASNYTAKLLKDANFIVIESEPDNRMDIYGRYLGYVWIDGKLLNLMLVEEAYTTSGSANSKYEEYFQEARIHAQITGRRYYGEIDPDYDYEEGDYK